MVRVARVVRAVGAVGISGRGVAARRRGLTAGGAVLAALALVLAWPAAASSSQPGNQDYSSIGYNRGGGYWKVVDGKGFSAVGGAPSFGGGPVTHSTLVVNPVGSGYWIVQRDGSVIAFGDAAPDLGRFPETEKFTKYHLYVSGGIAAVGATPTGKGLYGVDTQGHVWTLGDAVPLGDVAGQIGAAWPVGIVVERWPLSGQLGYWIADSRGGVYAKGGVVFQGSTGGKGKGNAGYAGFAGTTGGRGYCLLDAQGGLTPFGDAQASGCAHGSGPIGGPQFSGLALKPGGGYGLIREDGTVIETTAPASSAPVTSPPTWPSAPWCRGRAPHAC